MKQWLKTRKGRVQALGILLVCLVVLSVILFNTLISKLAERYSWYTSLTASADYGVSDECYAFLDRVLDGETPVTILFLRNRDQASTDDTERYLFETAEAIAARYPQITLSFCDPVENPDALRPYTEKTDPKTGKAALDETGEKETRVLNENGLILLSGDYYRVYDLEEFFVFEGGDTSKVRAYSGESKLVAGILHAMRKDAPLALLTNNHGEAFYDFELLYLLDDAGYAVDYIDLSKEEIPASCRLIVTYNPNTDLLDGDGLRASEAEILRNYLSVAGNHYLAFVGSETPRLSALESLLADYGVSFAYAAPDDAGNAYRYSIKDEAATLTSDGYTIYGKATCDLVSTVKDGAVFKNATAITVASGFVNRGEGVFTKANMTLYTLYSSSASAAAYAGGRRVGAGAFSLATFTEIAIGDGKSSVGVFASTASFEEDFLQSTVYGNRDALLRLCKLFGAGENPEGLSYKPFSSTRMSLVTTREKLVWTICLAALPLLVSPICALVVLIRRRNR